MSIYNSKSGGLLAPPFTSSASKKDLDLSPPQESSSDSNTSSANLKSTESTSDFPAINSATGDAQDYSIKFDENNSSHSTVFGSDSADTSESFFNSDNLTIPSFSDKANPEFTMSEEEKLAVAKIFSDRESSETAFSFILKNLDSANFDILKKAILESEEYSFIHQKSTTAEVSKHLATLSASEYIILLRSLESGVLSDFEKALDVTLLNSQNDEDIHTLLKYIESTLDTRDTEDDQVHITPLSGGMTQEFIGVQTQVDITKTEETFQNIFWNSNIQIDQLATSVMLPSVNPSINGVDTPQSSSGDPTIVPQPENPLGSFNMTVHHHVNSEYVNTPIATAGIIPILYAKEGENAVALQWIVNSDYFYYDGESYKAITYTVSEDGKTFHAKIDEELFFSATWQITASGQYMFEIPNMDPEYIGKIYGLTGNEKEYAQTSVFQLYAKTDQADGIIGEINLRINVSDYDGQEKGMIVQHNEAISFSANLQADADSVYEFNTAENVDLVQIPLSGDDIIYGTEASDTLSAFDGNDLLLGFDDDDFLFGGSGQDVLYGHRGNDYLDGGDGIDKLSGNAGNDLFNFDINDILVDGGDDLDGLLYSFTETDQLDVMETMLENDSNIKNIELLINNNDADHTLGREILDSFSAMHDHGEFDEGRWVMQQDQDDRHSFDGYTAFTYIESAQSTVTVHICDGTLEVMFKE